MRKIIFGGLFFAVLAAGTTHAAENYGQWTKSRLITLNPGSLTAAPVANFPLLVRLTPAQGDVFTQAAAGGADIRFSTANGTIPLKFERERWDAVNQLAEFWVLVPSVPAGSAAILTMHWGYNGTIVTDSSKGSAVFDTAFGWRGAWHLGKGRGAPGAVQDSDATVNANHLNWLRAASAESSSVVRGVIGLADSLPNDLPGTTSNFLAVGTNPSFLSNSTNGITLSAWVKRTGPGGGTATNPVSSDEGIAMRFRFTAGTGTVNGRLWGLEYTPATKGSPTSNAGPGDFNIHGNGYSFHYATNGTATTANERFLCSGVLSSGGWDHLVAAVDGTVQSLWVNGVLVARRSNETTTNLDIGNTGVALQTAFTLGKLDSADNTFNQSFNGVLDEVSFARTVRDSNWIRLAYATQKPNVTVVNILGTQGTAVPPGPPQGLAAVASNGAATVSWSAPATTGGDVITGYKAFANEDTAKSCLTTGSLSCVVAGLTNATGYSFSGIAFNSAGASIQSSPSNTVMPLAPAGVAGSPTGVSGISGNGQVTVSWTAGTAGTSATTSYTVISNPDSKTCTWTTGTLACAVTGLTNGTAYTFRVTATNTQGVSAPSTASAPVTPAGTPGAPTGVSGVAGNRQVTVSWTAPTSNGGSAITAYKAMAVEDTSKACTWSTGTLSCTVTGLTNGSTYTFRARATNAAGGGALSLASAVVTPLGVPSAPKTVTGVGAGSGTITVSWAPPDSNGGAAVTQYTVINVQDTAKKCTTNGALTCDVTGLASNTTAYTFVVRATNSVGTGPLSTASAGVTGLFGVSAVKGFGLKMSGPALHVQLPGTGNARIAILYPNGRTLWARMVGKDVSEVNWTGETAVGGRVSPGTYLVLVSLFNHGDALPVNLVTRITYRP